ncbi:MAG TPA: hypothetical protein VLC54_09810, partial [Anaeromyxobacter sp.]|nr:hypothetical protein [Anaeromyxobacter sp.]
ADSLVVELSGGRPVVPAWPPRRQSRGGGREPSDAASERPPGLHLTERSIATVASAAAHSARKLAESR